MSETTSAALASSPVKDSSNKGKAEDTKWGAQDTAKLLFIIMQHENPELAVQGWKGIGEKLQQAFGGKYTEDAAKYVLSHLIFY